MSRFTLPSEITDAVKNATKDSNGVKLPFAAPVMWWMNGNAALKNEAAITDARRFGGWGISKEELDELGVKPAPSWTLTEMTNSKGATYSAYICRTAWVAPIARRFAWFENEGKWRTSLNILSYLYLKNKEGALTPFGTVVLSAKSYTGTALDAAFKKFDSMSVNAREGAPAQFFLRGIGTFGNEVQYQDAKSKGGASSIITPPQLAVPSTGFDDIYMDKHFVGAEVAAKMAQYAKDATEWLDEWNKRNKKAEAAQDVNSELQAAEAAPADEFPY